MLVWQTGAGVIMGMTEQTIKRIAIGIVGGTLLVLGIAMIVLPGPAIILIPTGLALLASEFAWARWLLKKGEEKLEGMNEKHPEMFGWAKRLLKKTREQKE